MTLARTVLVGWWDLKPDYGEEEMRQSLEDAKRQREGIFKLIKTWSCVNDSEKEAAEEITDRINALRRWKGCDLVKRHMRLALDKTRFASVIVMAQTGNDECGYQCQVYL